MKPFTSLLLIETLKILELFEGKWDDDDNILCSIWLFETCMRNTP